MHFPNTNLKKQNTAQTSDLKKTPSYYFSVMFMNKIALVTGGNRGIGNEICRQLHKKGFVVILTARDKTKGKKAAEETGCDFFELEVTDKKSIMRAREYVQKKYGKLDVLINNAGIFIDHNKNVLDVDDEIIQRTLAVNYLGPLHMCQEFAGLLAKSEDARIINFSSGLGSLNDMGNSGSGYFAYSTSKAAINVLTIKLSQALPDVKVNSLCPGWVKTDMGGPNAERPVEKGAETAVWLATAQNIPSGRFFRDMEEIEW